MAKQKLEMTKTLKGNGTFDVNNMTVQVADEIIILKDKLNMFHGEEIKFSFALSDIIATEKAN